MKHNQHRGSSEGGELYDTITENVFTEFCHDILCSQFTGKQYKVSTLNCDQKYIQVK